MNRTIPIAILGIIAGLLLVYVIHTGLQSDIPDVVDIEKIKNDVVRVKSEITILENKEELPPIEEAYAKLSSVSSYYGIKFKALSFNEVENLSNRQGIHKRWFYKVSANKMDVYTFLYKLEDIIPISIETLLQEEDRAEAVFTIYGS